MNIVKRRVNKKVSKNPSAVITSDISIRGLIDEQTEKIKDSLTFDNPAFNSAVRFSKYGYTNISPYLTYYHSECENLHVPLGTDLSCIPSLEKVDLRNLVCANTVPDFSLTLRPDQRKAAQAFIHSNKGIEQQGCVKMPTGKGKTILALYLAYFYGLKTLIIVHKDDLVTGWMKDIDLSFDHKVSTGIIKAQKKKVGDFITIATVQTLSRMDSATLHQYTNQFGFVVLDEMHHCPASTFGVVAEFNSRYKLGLTATPERKDGLKQVMQLYFGGFCYKYKSKVKDVDILPVEIILRPAKFVDIEPTCVKSKSGSWSVSNLLSASTDIPDNDRDIKALSDVPYNIRPNIDYGAIMREAVRQASGFVRADIVWEYYGGHSCVVFFANKVLIDEFAEALYKENRVPRSDIITYYGDNNSKDNDTNLVHAEQKRNTITLATYSKATEGTNVKQWEVAFLVSSINDEKNVEQAVGRIRRVCDKPKLETAKVYDYRFPNVYSVRNHGATRDSRYRKLKFKYAKSQF